jgi:transposase
MRYWVRKLDAAQRVKQVWAGKLEGLLARHWPEAARLVSGSGATLCGALAKWGDPAALAADPGAAEELSRLGGRYLAAEKIAALIESARTSGGVRMGEWERREMKEAAGQVLERRREVGGCKRRLRVLAGGDAAIEAQVPAVGLVTACVLRVCLGDPSDYGSAAAYRKAMGLNLVEQSSGKSKGQLHLSKRGQRLARKWLYFGALRWMRDPAVRPWVLAKKARDGGKGSRAVVAVMRKLALAAWHVAVHGEAFDPKRLFPGGRAKAPEAGAATRAKAEKAEAAAI